MNALKFDNSIDTQSAVALDPVALRHSAVSLSTVTAPPVTTSVAIWARGLQMVFQSGDEPYRVLDGIDLEIERGTFQLLIGPSGVGKTTLLYILAGILTPTVGRMALLGEEMLPCESRRQKCQQRQRIDRLRLEKMGFVFQEFNLFSALTAQENIEIVLQLKGVRGRAVRQQARELLAQVEMTNKAHLLPRHLSGGQKQRVAIARALAGQPQIIFADEPTASLDSRNSRIVINLLRQMAQMHNCTILMTTHDHRVIDLADRVMYLEDGKLGGEECTAAGVVKSRDEFLGGSGAATQKLDKT